MNQVGIHTGTLVGALSGLYSSVTATSTFSITVVDPCLTATIIGTPCPSATVTIGSSVSTYQNFWYDSVTNLYPSSLCGPTTLTITKTTTAALYMESTMGSIFVWTTSLNQDILTITPTRQATVGTFIFTYQLCLTNYSSRCSSSTTTITITSCI